MAVTDADIYKYLYANGWGQGTTLASLQKAASGINTSNVGQGGAAARRTMKRASAAQAKIKNFQTAWNKAWQTLNLQEQQNQAKQQAELDAQKKALENEQRLAAEQEAAAAETARLSQAERLAALMESRARGALAQA